jgi:hypothetical protein
LNVKKQTNEVQTILSINTKSAVRVQFYDFPCGKFSTGSFVNNDKIFSAFIRREIQTKLQTALILRIYGSLNNKKKIMAKSGKTSH